MLIGIFRGKFHPYTGGDDRRILLSLTLGSYQRIERENITAGRSAVIISWQGREIVAPMTSDQKTQLLRGDHLDSVTPFVKMPSHLQPTSRLKADDQSTIRFVLQCLIGVEHVVPRDGGRATVEPPHDSSEFRLGME
jgi:hypothetical protein